LTAERRYLPAASLHVLLPAYDPIMAVLGFRRGLLPLVEQAALQPGHTVLDVGCGTGTLAVLVKQRHPDVELVGIDPDPEALARAERKTSRAGVAVRFERGFGDALPHPDAAFDRVFSSMMFHHVPKNEKPRVMAEVRRVLKPGGRLEFVDMARALAHERLIAYMSDAGLVGTTRTLTRRTIGGAIAYYQAGAPL
jgi:ubiquinone/menaquinone biosynthesis C-methylase UbiE